LLKNFTKNDINNQLLIDEIDILEENQLENQKNDLTKLKDEIINKNTNEIQSKLESIRNTYQNIDTRFKPNLQSIEWKQFVYQKEQNIDVIKILKKNNIDPNFYFQIRYTAEQIIKNTNELSEDQIQFIQQFNTLNRSLNINYQINIPIDKIRNTPKPNNLSDVIKTPDAVFAYPSIREYTTKQPDILTNKNRLSISPKLQADIRSNTPKDQQEEL
jgi:adenosine deaminase